MNQFLKRTLQGDYVVWIVFSLLCIISVSEMFSASSSLIFKSGSIHGPILRHVMFLAAGFVAMLVVQVIDFKVMRFLGYVGLFFSLILLPYTILFGVEQAGAARFLSIAGFQFQPSELAKLSVLIVLADLIERSQSEEFQNKYYKFIAIGLILVCGLIFIENLSTAAILFFISMVMMWIGGIDWKKLARTCGIVVGAVVLIIAIAWIIPESVYRESNNPVLGIFDRAYTWVARIENFVGADDEEKSKFVITDSNFQESHAQIAIARGGFIPKGPGTSVERNYLPEAFSDFIFAIIVEEGGFFAGIIVIMLYMVLLFRAGKVARQSDSLFCAILVIGVTLLIVLQAFIHIGVSVHLGPVTGQPLPLISRGGTSILVNCVYFGIIISVTRSIQNQMRAKAGLEAKPLIAEDSTATEDENENKIEVIK